MTDKPASRWYQFRLRTLLVVVSVAVVAAALGQWLWSRSVAFTDRANAHELIVTKLTGLQPVNCTKEDIAHIGQVLSHHKQLLEKYKRAARYPWLPVEDDPNGPPMP